MHPVPALNPGRPRVSERLTDLRPRETGFHHVDRTQTRKLRRECSQFPKLGRPAGLDHRERVLRRAITAERANRRKRVNQSHGCCAFPASQGRPMARDLIRKASMSPR